MRKVKTVDFSETFAASDLKIGRSRHLIETENFLNMEFAFKYGI